MGGEYAVEGIYDSLYHALASNGEQRLRSHVRVRPHARAATSHGYQKFHLFSVVNWCGWRLDESYGMRREGRLNLSTPRYKCERRCVVFDSSPQNPGDRIITTVTFRLSSEEHASELQSR